MVNRRILLLEAIGINSRKVSFQQFLLIDRELLVSVTYVKSDAFCSKPKPI